MNEGWLWLSILKTTAWPSPMSTTPAFSPGPWITRGPWVGNLARCLRLDLYEQCSDHITEKTPSSTRLGSRFRRCTIRSYSSTLRPKSWAVCLSVASGGMARLLVGFGGAGDSRGTFRRPSGFAPVGSRAWRGADGSCGGSNREPVDIRLRAPNRRRQDC